MITQAQAFEALLSAQTGREEDWQALYDVIERMAIAKDRNWEAETTRYVFEDNSVLVVNEYGEYFAEEPSE